MHPTATKALIYATALADELIERHGPETNKVVEHTRTWPRLWPRRLRPKEGLLYQGSAQHLEVRLVLTPEYVHIKLIYGNPEIPQTEEGHPIH